MKSNADYFYSISCKKCKFCDGKIGELPGTFVQAGFDSFVPLTYCSKIKAWVLRDSKSCPERTKK